MRVSCVSFIQFLAVRIANNILISLTQPPLKVADENDVRNGPEFLKVEKEMYLGFVSTKCGTI